MTTRRECYNCRWFEFDPGSPPYSEFTPGSDMALICHKGHWRSNWGGSAEDVRKGLASGPNCPDFEEESAL